MVSYESSAVEFECPCPACPQCVEQASMRSCPSFHTRASSSPTFNVKPTKRCAPSISSRRGISLSALCWSLGRCSGFAIFDQPAFDMPRAVRDEGVQPHHCNPCACRVTIKMKRPITTLAAQRLGDVDSSARPDGCQYRNGNSGRSRCGASDIELANGVGAG